MANKQRKLFPTSSANQTVDCPDICDPTCPPYGCYPFPDFDSLPPPPPPQDVTNKGQHVSPYVILIVSLVASLFLLVSCYVIIIKYCSGSSRFRRRSPRSSTESTEPDEDLINEIHGPAIDHPIWYIRTVGLQSSVINSITIFKYKKGENLVEGTNCSVCLNEFQEDETLRLLPKCNHAFHIPCIDTWLRSHTNCPLCRAGIVPNVGSDAGFSPNDTNSSVLVVNDDTQVESLENGGELGVNLVTDVEVCENRGSTGDGIEIPLFDYERKEIGGFKTDLDSNGNGVFGAIGNSCENDTIQTMRRSYSVDLDSIADVVIDFGSQKSEGSSGNPKVDGLNDEIRASYLGQSRVFSKMGGYSIEESLHKRPVPMKRSFSCGGRSFLSRQYRSHNAILPL